MIYVFILILILYARTYKYHCLIDDPVPPSGYLYELPRKVNPDFYDQRKPLLWTIKNIVVFMGVCSLIYAIFGIKPAILYAIYPINVSGVAWGRTGSYYMTTVLFVLMAHYGLASLSGIHFIGAELPFLATLILILIIYVFALNSTVLSLSYAFIAPLFNIWGLALFFPLVMFFRGKRWRTGSQKRKERHEEIGMETKFQFKKLWNIPRVFSYYIYISSGLSPLGFFHSFGRSPTYYKRWFLWFSVLVCGVFIYWGWNIDPWLTLWWLLSMGIFTNFVTLGQFVSERYTFLANVALCVMVAKVLPHDLYLILATIWFCRSYDYTKSYKHNSDLFSQSISSFPKSPENYTNYSSYLLERNPPRYLDAIKPLRIAIQLAHGNKWMLHSSLGKCYYHMNDPVKSLEHIREAMRTCNDLKAKNDLRDIAFKVNEDCRKLNRRKYN